MYNKIKILLLIIVILTTLKYVDANGENQYCSGVNVCSGINPGNYTINCNPGLDSFCPENYSRSYWQSSECPTLNYGKCSPCDPDCNKCAILELYVQPNAEACDNIQNLIIVRNPASNYNLKAWRSYNLSNNANLLGDNKRCNKGQTCYIYFNDSLREYERGQSNRVECFGGDQYCYVANTHPPTGQILGCGRTRPGLNLSIYPSGGVVSGIVRINASGRSRLGVTVLNVKVTKWNSKFNAFRLVNVRVPTTHPDYCSFRLNCDQADPNKCGYFIDETFTTNPPITVNRTANWDTTRCENSNYTIYGYVSDPSNSATKQVNLLTNNPNAPCTDECPIFTSKTLNTVLTKIKTWLNP